jgi:hypothetical protein
MSHSPKIPRSDDLAGRLLYLGVLPLWGLPGLADWVCHRKSRIEDPERGGLRESLLHVLMFVEGAIPLGLTLFAETNPLVVTALAASAAVHEVTADWDLRVAHQSDREVSPFEQQVHTALEAIPFVVCLLSALRMPKSQDTSERNWTLRRKSQPLPPLYIGITLLATGLAGVVPHLEELLRCARADGRGAAGRRGDTSALTTTSTASPATDVARAPETQGDPDDDLQVTKKELYEEAREAGIEGRSNMTKEELRQALDDGEHSVH